jgi:aspartate kinase
MDNIRVKKFGGTSVGSVERIQAIADRLIREATPGVSEVIVVSAMGDTTDDLITLAQQITDSPDSREYDALVSTGENISASLLAMSLIAKGQKAISLTGAQAGVQTEEFYTRARIVDVRPTRLLDELKKSQFVIVTGFQGINRFGDVTTIGRGGSDTSAVVLAAALKSKECEIYTDVDGVYTTDPRVVKSAQKLHEISYEEMLELASAGAKVLHPRSVECAKANNIVLHVRSSFDSIKGTLVKEISEMEMKRPVTGVTIMEEEAIISVRNVKDSPGVAGLLFSKIAEAGINVDMIVQGSGENAANHITFTVDQAQAALAKKISESILNDMGASEVTLDKSVAKLSIVGIGMVSKPGVASKMFSVLGKNNINIKLITTSEIKISCAIDRKEAKRAVALLHDAFELHDAHKAN